jgi:hypothetical protein
MTVFCEDPIVFSIVSLNRVMGYTMDHFVTDLDKEDIADVETRTNATGDNISGILLVVF